MMLCCISRFLVPGFRPTARQGASCKPFSMPGCLCRVGKHYLAGSGAAMDSADCHVSGACRMQGIAQAHLAAARCLVATQHCL